MLNSRAIRFVLTSLILFVGTAGLLGYAGFAYAADRTVIGELWSQDG